MTRNEAIRRIEEHTRIHGANEGFRACHIQEALNMAVDALKAQEPREPHYTKLEYIVNGMPVAINHPECPRCYDNGLVLWDAEIEKGAAYCKRCGQAVKWE